MPIGFDSIRAGASGSADAYEIDYSCRFNDNDSAYLYRTPGSAGNRRKWTLSLWVKRHNLGINQTILSANTGTNDHNALLFRSDDKLDFVMVAGGSVTGRIITTAVYRDVASWYHIVFQYDSANTTAGDRMKLFVNGDEVTSFSTDQNPSLNVQTYIASNVIHNFGRKYYVSSEYIDMSVSDVVFTDGELNNPSVFGEISSVTGQWIPIVLDGLSFGTTGYQFDFANSAALGNDVSGNNNDWTSSGLATNDQVTDTPTNNFCVMSPIDRNSNATLSNGGLGLAWASGAGHFLINSTARISSGKWYWEIKNTTGGTGCNYHSGVSVADPPANFAMDKTIGNVGNPNGYAIQPYTGDTLHLASSASYGLNLQTANDILMTAVDLDNGKIWWGKNGTWFASGDPAAGTNAAFTDLSGSFIPAIAGYSAQILELDFGQLGFTYTPPTDFLALNTANLPDPAISDPSAHFQTTLYTGNATASRAITQDGNTQFGPDMVWIKNRDQGDEWKALDTVRGATKEWNLDSTNSESTDSNGLTAFSATDGFTLGTGAGGYNDNSEDFVAYQWEKGATPGFDIVSYTGAGGTKTVAHSLTVAPDLIIVKNLGNSGPRGTVLHSAIGAAKYGYISDTFAFEAGGAVNRWGNNSVTVEPTSSVFTVGSSTDLNQNTKAYIAYLFAAIEGFSAFGSYTGNGSANGPMINLGFKPAFVIFKKSSGADSWEGFDNARDTDNPASAGIFVDGNGIDLTGRDVDFLSNGFKLRTGNGTTNESGYTYIYMAWAETPFKTATAR